MRGADLAGWLIVPLGAGRGRLLHRGGAPRPRTGGGRSRSSGRAWWPSAPSSSPCSPRCSTSSPTSGQDPRQRTALRAVFWSTMHVLNVTAKVLIVLGAVDRPGRQPGRRRSDARSGGAPSSARARATLADPRPQGASPRSPLSLGGLVGLVWPRGHGRAPGAGRGRRPRRHRRGLGLRPHRRLGLGGGARAAPPPRLAVTPRRLALGRDDRRGDVLTRPPARAACPSSVPSGRRTSTA